MSEEIKETKEVFQPSAKQQAVVDELMALQDALGRDGKRISDRLFAERLGLGSGSTWSLIRSGKYWEMLKGDPGTYFGELRRALMRFGAEKQFETRFEGKRFVSNDYFAAVFGAVEECMGKKISERKRIVAYLAPTGGGKSMVSCELWRRFGAKVVNARKDWRRSARVGLMDICKKFDLETKQNYSQTKLENLLLDEFRSQVHALVIDEGEYFGPDILDCLKLFINESRLVVVILAIPEQYDRWNAWFQMQSDQIKTRTHLVVRLTAITPDMLDGFMERVEWESPDDQKRATALLVEKANQLGAFDLADSVVGRLEGRGKVDGKRFSAMLAKELGKMGVK